MGTSGGIARPRRGEVYLVDFDPTVGAEIQKRRPALVIQNDIDNRYSPITIVAAITSAIEDHRFATELRLQPPEGGLSKPSTVLFNQLRSVDRHRLLRRLGRLHPETMRLADRALKLSLGLVEI